MIYLDHNATAPLWPEVAEAMAQCLRAGHANPASQHAAGRQARRRLEDAREQIATHLGARLEGTPADRLIFTSGGTESNNLALLGLAARLPGGAGQGSGAASNAQVIVSAIEHPSVLAAADRLEQNGTPVCRLAPTAAGVIDLAQLAAALETPTRLVSIQLANHETGALQPLAEIAALCRARGVLCHTDAVQAVGKLPVDFQELGVDALTLCAHKLHGPVGIGALLLRGGVEIQPQLVGGAQQLGSRAGTEPLALAVGFATALDAYAREAQARSQRLAELQNQFETHLRAELPEIVINAAAAPRAPHTSNVAFPGLDRQRLLIALDLAGVACSTGSACASGSTDPSPVLAAMGCPEPISHGSLRFSFGAGTTPEEVATAAEKIVAIASDFRTKTAGPSGHSTARESTRNPL